MTAPAPCGEREGGGGEGERDWDPVSFPYIASVCIFSQIYSSYTVVVHLCIVKPVRAVIPSGGWFIGGFRQYMWYPLSQSSQNSSWSYTGSTQSKTINNIWNVHRGQKDKYKSYCYSLTRHEAAKGASKSPVSCTQGCCNRVGEAGNCLGPPRTIVN